jgi:hypothetical protein
VPQLLILKDINRYCWYSLCGPQNYLILVQNFISPPYTLGASLDNVLVLEGKSMIKMSRKEMGRQKPQNNMKCDCKKKYTHHLNQLQKQRPKL